MCKRSYVCIPTGIPTGIPTVVINKLLLGEHT